MSRPQGWAHPRPTAKKFHYFKSDSPRSLCKKWMFFNTDPRAYDDTAHDHEENCAACMAAMKKE